MRPGSDALELNSAADYSALVVLPVSVAVCFAGLLALGGTVDSSRGAAGVPAGDGAAAGVASLRLSADGGDFGAGPDWRAEEGDDSPCDLDLSSSRP